MGKRRSITGTFGPVRSTRYRDLRYQHRIDHWRLIVDEEEHGIGPYYATERELLADLDRMSEWSGYTETRI
jgi:hypothetical protein